MGERVVLRVRRAYPIKPIKHRKLQWNAMVAPFLQYQSVHKDTKFERLSTPCKVSRAQLINSFVNRNLHDPFWVLHFECSAVDGPVVRCPYMEDPGTTRMGAREQRSKFDNLLEFVTNTERITNRRAAKTLWGLLHFL